MNLIIGLGNPGKNFQYNRHNVGFLMVDFLNKKNKREDFSYNKKFDSLISKSTNNIICKPQSFMNNSGNCVRKIMDFYKGELTKKILIYDDLDLEFGSYKIGLKGPRVHNGVNSVLESGGEDFLHIRIGTRGEEYKIIKDSQKSVADFYILKDFSKKEKEGLANIFEEIYKEIEEIL